ncbi:MAG: VOC family protein [Pseudomonadota bacterium]|nr:VOC family protein [Pseudomonadota bacterium]
MNQIKEWLDKLSNEIPLGSKSNTAQNGDVSGVEPIPAGYHTVTPNLVFRDSNKAIEFYKAAFNAEVLDFLPNSNSNGVMHATLKIGDSIIMLGDEMSSEKDCPKSAETLGSSSISLFLYVPNADDFYKKAVDAGAISTMPVMDMFWGDRVGQIKDPFGYFWMIGTHKEDLSDEEIKKGAEDFFATNAKK